MVNVKSNPKFTKVIKEMNQAEYAIHRGVSPPMVVKWKQKGLLKLTKSGKIDVNQTDEILDNLVNSRPAKKVNKTKRKSVNKKEHIQKKKVVEDVDESASSNDLNDDILCNQEIFAKLKKILDSADLLSTHEAIRVKENCLAIMRWLEAKIKSGQLVDAQLVSKQVYDFYRRERDALLTLPNRISAVMAAELGVDQNRLTISLEREFNDFLRDRSEQPRLQFDGS